MLKGIPKCLSPDLLKTISEMGHGDKLVVADANYPAASSAKHSILLRADGVQAPELIDAILQLFPLDNSVKKPVLIMNKQECDKNLSTPIWDEFHNIVCKYDNRGNDCIDMIDRFEFYKEAERAYAVLATGETSLYGCIILQKGTI